MSDQMNAHLSPETLAAFVDGELSADDLARASQHLAECIECTRRALGESLLKRSTTRAGLRHTMPEAFETRILHAIAAQQSAPAPARPGRSLSAQSPSARSSSAQSPSESSLRRPQLGALGWAGALAAVLLVSVSGFVAHHLALRSAHSSALVESLVTEVVDEHIAAMAAAAPQVISTDRHTVKPWFQGKLAFSFDLPSALPPDITLDGADLVQLDGRPAAQLLFSIGKHHASVFLRQRSEGDPAIRSTQRNGFHVDGFRTSGLDALAVSDADPQRLHALALAVQAAQSSQ
jgi:anti-sigma factor RsiW